jgi:hypothetical protein
MLHVGQGCGVRAKSRGGAVNAYRKINSHFSAALHLIWCTSNLFQKTYGPNVPSGGLNFFLYLISHLAVVGAHEDTEMRFRKRCFALLKAGRDWTFMVERLWIEYALKGGNYRQMEDAGNHVLRDFMA